MGMRILMFGKKSEDKKPYFMKRKRWYVQLPDGETVPDYPRVNMVLTDKAPHKAVVSYWKYFDLGILTTFYMGKDGQIEEEDWDIWSPEARAELQREYDEAE